MKAYCVLMIVWWSVAIMVQFRDLFTKTYPLEREPLKIQTELGVLLFALTFLILGILAME